MKLRFVLRDIMHSRSQAVVFVLCVALSLVSIVSVNSFRRDVRQSIISDARGLHGGDIIVHSHYDLSPGLQAELDTLVQENGVQGLRTWEFYSVARRADGQDSLFSNIKAVADDYPLYGQVVLQSGRDFGEVLKQGKAVVGAAVLERLGLTIGDHILLGSGDFEIVDMVVRESMRPVDFFNFGPRILVSAADLGRMDLVKKGSRVHYETLIKVADQAMLEPMVERLQGLAVEGQERVGTYATAGSRVKRFFDNLLFFLSLISVFTMLLAGIGMQSSLAALLRGKEKSTAIIRSLGANRSFILRHYLLIVLLLSTFGCSLGIVSGLLLERSFDSLFSGLLPDNIVLGASVWDIVEGTALGLAVVCFYTLLPLAGIRNIKPKTVFSGEGQRRTKGREAYVLLGCGILLLGGLVIRQLEDVQIGLYLMGGILGLIIIVSLMVAGMLAVLTRFKVISLPVRQAVRSLVRPGNATRPIVATLASAFAVLLVIYLLENNLQGTYINSYPPDAPNLFCLDIQKDQRDSFRELVGNDVELFPIIRARLNSINGEKIDRKEERKKRGDSLAREFNLSYREVLLDDEVVSKGGSLFGHQPKGDRIPVSVLDTVAEMGDMELGDVLVFNIQGVPLTAEVSSIRSRTKSMLYPFFYFIFPQKNLIAAPQTFFAALHVEKESVSALENRIVNVFPNISTINVSETAVELGKMVDKISVIVTFFASFSILAGALILVSSILATRMERVKEVVYYKILGAKSGFVLQVFFFENLLLAIFSGGCALLVAQLAGWGICHYILEIQHNAALLECIVFLTVTSLAVVALGLSGSWSIIKHKPADYLRGQGA